MKEIQYKTFSLRTHQNNIGRERSSVCEFELTFRCALRCRHCYSDCYNKTKYLKRELGTKEVKIILDEVYKSGVLWLCFTGGDPLARLDFLDIYAYAKEKGFIITVFTSGYYINRGIIKHLKQSPPFAIELTLNAVNKELYERISRVKGSFIKVMEAIDLILKEGLPLKIKTQITKDNVKEVPRIKKFLAKLGLEFIPSYILYPRLDGDLTPCNLRVPAQELLNLNGRTQEKEGTVSEPAEERCNIRQQKDKKYNFPLFPCVVGSGDGFRIDPYGNVFLCSLMRDYKFNLLQVKIDYALDKLLRFFRKRRFLNGSSCEYCSLRKYCAWCPGRAYLEKGNLEAPIEYYCALAGFTKNEI